MRDNIWWTLMVEVGHAKTLRACGARTIFVSADNEETYRHS